MKKSERIEKAAEKLAALLKPILVDPTSDGYAEVEVDVVCWDYNYGGARIAEISCTRGNSGWSYMRSDFLYEKPGSLHKLFMLCEEWLVLTAFGDEMEDLPGLEAAIKTCGELPKVEESEGPEVHVYALKIISKNGLSDHYLEQKLIDNLDAMLPPHCRFVIEDAAGVMEPAADYEMEEEWFAEEEEEEEEEEDGDPEQD